MRSFRIVIQELAKNPPLAENTKEKHIDSSVVHSPTTPGPGRGPNPWASHVDDINWFVLNVDKFYSLAPKKIKIPPGISRKKNVKKKNELELANIQQKNLMESRSFMHMDNL